MELKDIILIFLTAVYTIGSLVMSYISIRTLGITSSEIKKKDKLLKVKYISNVYRNFREIYTLAIKDSEYSKLLAESQGLPVEDSRKEYLASFLINHTFEIYTMYKNDLLINDFWLKVLKDMRVLFGWEFIKEKWEKSKVIYPEDFIKYIEESVLNPKIF